MGTEVNAATNPLGMSDDDFLKLPAPPSASADGEGREDAQGDKPNTDGDGDDSGAGDGKQDDDSDSQKDNDAGAGDDLNSDGKDSKGEDSKDDKEISSDKAGESGNLSKDKSQGKDPADKKPADGKAPDAKDSKDPKQKDKPAEGDGSQGDGKDPPGSKADEKQAIPDYKVLYEKIMAPLRANGKNIDLKSPEEAIQLMQLGANYTRKMQAIAPHRKILLMLENNQLLDQDKLSYLIDLDKKNPEAIKKLIKDAGIDPREIDLEDPQAKTYVQGNHGVSEEEANFRTQLDELSSNPEGKVTLQMIQSQWDQASKEVLWKQPEVMSLIHSQRESGIYDLVAAEIDRQRTLGTLPANVPFLHAYKAIGDQFAEEGKFDHLNKAPDPKSQEQKTPVVTRVQTPKPAVKNGDKASAASPTRTNTRKVDISVNPLALDDDTFMKQVAVFEGRL